MVTPADDLRRARERAVERHLEALVSLVATGHEPAFCELYEATCARAFGVARSILGDRALAEEAVADGFAQVWRDATRYEAARATVPNWIAMIVRARAIDARRRARTRAAREDELHAATGTETALPTPLAEAHERERERLVRAALTSLPPEQRVAVEAAFLGGLTHAEVARALDAPLGTIKSRIRSGLAVLRLSLASLEAELA
jgi:RNA polymerase sigma-70 factor (ECF subfamily)